MHPGWRRCVALLHRGHGRPHLDLVLHGGARCLTMALESRRWRPQPPHRPRYLHYAGPVPGGRGRISRHWHGILALRRHALGLELRTPGGTGAVLRRDGVVILPGPPHSQAWDWMTRA